MIENWPAKVGINHSRHVHNDQAGVKLRAVVPRDFLLIFQIDPGFSGIPVGCGGRVPSIDPAIYLDGV